MGSCQIQILAVLMYIGHYSSLNVIQFRKIPIAKLRAHSFGPSQNFITSSLFWIPLLSPQTTYHHDF